MLVVRGITTNGAHFRPNDWANMLVGRYLCSTNTVKSYAGISYQEAKSCNRFSNYIHIHHKNSCKDYSEIHIDQAIKNEYPTVYEHVRQFAITNNLQYTET